MSNVLSKNRYTRTTGFVFFLQNCLSVVRDLIVFMAVVSLSIAEAAQCPIIHSMMNYEGGEHKPTQAWMLEQGFSRIITFVQNSSNSSNESNCLINGQHKPTQAWMLERGFSRIITFV